MLSPKLDWSLANPKWAAELNPVLANPLVGGHLIKNVPLVSGVNIVNHGLGANLQGYLVVLNSSAVTINDHQSRNQTPQLTLILNTSGATTVTLYVF
jgi:hypothetical protein